jgi:hypothetical protein
MNMQSTTREQIAREIAAFERKKARERATERRFKRIFGVDDKGNGGDIEPDDERRGDPGGDPGGDEISAARSALDHAANLLIEADPLRFPTRTHALRYLMASKGGARLLQRVGPHLRTTTKRAHSESSFRMSPEPTAKECSAAAAKRALGHISEHAFTGIVTEYAKERYPNDRPDVAFAKVYNEASDEGMAIRAARHAIKQRDFGVECRKRLGDPLPFEVTLEPRSIDALAVRDLDPDEALKQLHELAAEQRKRAPWMTTQQAFAAIYNDAANAEAVARYKEARRRQLGVE